MNMRKPVRRLYDMEYDEVSIVNRPANSDSEIAIFKSMDSDLIDVEDAGDLFDEEGELLDISELEPGESVFTVEGEEFMFVPDDDFETAGVSDGVTKSEEDMGDHMSLGDVLLEELSKADGESERQAIIADAMDEVEVAKAAAAEAWETVEAEREARYDEAFFSKAAEYNVPVAPEVLGPILKSMATVLDEDQLDTLDQLFTAIGEVLYDEVGYEGDSDNDYVLDEVNHHAAELVGKADVSGAEAISAVFEANPEAYEAYLSEGR